MNGSLSEQLTIQIHDVFENLFKNQLKDKVNVNQLERMLQWLGANKDKIVHEFERDYYYLNNEFERNLMSLLLEKRINGPISHYTSLDSAIKILISNKIRLSSIIGLNDNSEIDFSDLTDIKDPYHHKRIDYLNSRVILSLSKQLDNLNQWRLYGDDGAGVSMDFIIRKKESNTNNSIFDLHNIFYGRELIIALREVKRLIHNNVSGSRFITEEFDRQKYFFKDPIYANEEEVRLLANTNYSKDTKWYYNRFNVINTYVEYELISDNSTLPVELRSITLGPKCANAEINKAQLQKYIRDHYPNNKILVKLSEIKSYR